MLGRAMLIGHATFSAWTVMLCCRSVHCDRRANQRDRKPWRLRKMAKRAPRRSATFVPSSWLMEIERAVARCNWKVRGARVPRRQVTQYIAVLPGRSGAAHHESHNMLRHGYTFRRRLQPVRLTKVFRQRIDTAALFSLFLGFSSRRRQNRKATTPSVADPYHPDSPAAIFCHDTDGQKPDGTAQSSCSSTDFK